MRKKLTTAGIIMGIIVVAFGIYCMICSCSYNGTYSEYASFGGDFYTYSYEATMNAANNVRALGYTVEEAANVLMKGIGMLLIAIGAFEIIYFMDKKSLLEEEVSKTVIEKETSLKEEISETNIKEVSNIEE